MSEKIKGMYGSETRADEVLEWLESQGAVTCMYNKFSEDIIYYVNEGRVRAVGDEHAVLFDIVELPRWRAIKGKTYYFVNSCGNWDMWIEKGESVDNCRYRVGNYFKTREEAEIYAEKFREIFKERRQNDR